MADADFVRATITNAPDGFSVAVVLRRGERIDMWGVNFVASFDEAENVARTFALPARRTLGSGRGALWVARASRSLAAAISCVLKAAGQGIETFRPFLRERFGLGCAGHIVCPALGPVGSVRDTLDKFVQFAFE
jgi:hypothetical protein